MCRKVELFDKRMVLGVVVPKIIPQMMQFKKLYQHQIEVNPLGRRNLCRVQPALRHLIDFITVQHQVGCESVMLVKTDMLILNGQKLVQGMAQTDLRNVNRKELVDIDEVEIRKDLSQRERMVDFISQIKNPYCYLDKGMVVKISFAGENRLEDTLKKCARTHRR